MKAQQNQEDENQKNEKMIDQLVEEYNKLMNAEFIEKERKNQQKYIDLQFKFSQTLTINFVCCISRTKVKIPVAFKKCVEQCKHFDDYFDLKELLIYIKIWDTKPRKLQCPSCKEEINFQNRSQKIDTIQDLLVPQALICMLRKQVGIFPKDILYFHKQNLIIPLYKGKYQEHFTKYYSDANYPIESLLLQPIKPDSQFFQIAMQLKDYYGCDFVNVCLQSSLRVNIPVRGNQCVHYECYDLIGLHKHMVENKNEILPCVAENCQSLFKLNDPDTFCIDHDLLKAGREGLSFSINFTYMPHYKILSEILTQKQRDEIVLAYRDKGQQQDNLEYLNTIYEMSEQIFLNNDNNRKQTEEFIKNNPQINLEDTYQLSKCPIIELGIELPARCRNCKDYRVSDLRYFVCILHQVKNENETQGVKKFLIKCPLCNNPFQKNPKPPLKFPDQVYIDVKMLKFFVHTPFFNRSLENYKKFLKYLSKPQKKQMNQKHFEIFQQIQKEIWQQAKSTYMYKISLKCIITGNPLTIPVRSKSCPQVHYNCYDYQSILEFIKDGGNFEQYKCPICQVPTQSIYNLFIDKQLAEAMEKQGEQLNNLAEVIFQPIYNKFIFI